MVSYVQYTKKKTNGIASTTEILELGSNALFVTSLSLLFLGTIVIFSVYNDIVTLTNLTAILVISV